MKSNRTSCTVAHEAAWLPMQLWTILFAFHYTYSTIAYKRFLIEI